MIRRSRIPVVVALSGKACQGDEDGDFRPLIRTAQLPTVEAESLVKAYSGEQSMSKVTQLRDIRASLRAKRVGLCMLFGSCPFQEIQTVAGL